MIPPFDYKGRLPPGIYVAVWEEFVERFGWNNHRERLLEGLKRALKILQQANCKKVYVDGSFVTAKELPGDFDVCWSVNGVLPDKLDPVLLDFTNRRAAQKIKFLGELFPAEGIADSHKRTFLDFFQIDKDSGEPKGIILIDLRSMP
jgi:hypothetical protein